MANAWFRMYAEFLHDPKVQMLSESDQRRYIMLLCIRCSNGDVTLHDDEVAFQLRISNEEWSKTKAVLLSKNLISDDSTPTAWDKRQFASDSSAARVSKHRANKKRACNVTSNADVTKTNDLDTDTETEEPPKSSSLRSEDLPPPPAKSKTFKTWIAEIRLSGEKAISDYKPVWAYAERVGIPADWVEIAWLKFRERYSDANNARKRYTDWRRVFLNAVEGNWFKLWYARDGTFCLTTVGQQADMETREQQA